jgi:hypothetical protein
MSACRWPGCTTAIISSMWGCKPHWFALPKDIRDRIWDAYLHGSVEDLKTSYDAAQTWIAEHNARPADEAPRIPQVAKCTACGREIIWLRTRAGKNMPVHAETVQAGDNEYTYGKHEPHWGACPKANEFRKAK